MVREPLHPAVSKFRPGFVMQLMRGRKSKTFFVCNDGDDNTSPSFLTVKLSPRPFFTEGLTKLGCKSLLQHHRKTNTCTRPLRLISSPYSMNRNILARTGPGCTMGLVLLSQCCLLGSEYDMGMPLGIPGSHTGTGWHRWLSALPGHGYCCWCGSSPV